MASKRYVPPPQRRRPPRPPTKKPAGKGAKAEPASEVKKPKRNYSVIITVSAILLVIAVVIGSLFYIANVLPYQKAIIKVDSQSVNIRYLLDRILAAYNTSSAGIDIQGMMQTIASEMSVDQEAPQYVGQVTDADIDQYLRNAAQESGGITNEADYRVWYKERLTVSGLSEKQFKDIVRNSVFSQRMTEALGSRVSPVTAQVHLNIIFTTTQAQAAEAKARIDAGENFADVAKAVSIDSSTKDNGGDAGWVPIKLLGSTFEPIISALDVGVCSAPVRSAQPSSTNSNPPYVIIMVSEKDAAREATADQLTSLKNRAFQDWVSELLQTKRVVFLGKSSGSFDEETRAWLNYEVQKMIEKNSRGTPATTETTSPATTTTSPATQTTTPTSSAP